VLRKLLQARADALPLPEYKAAATRTFAGFTYEYKFSRFANHPYVVDVALEISIKDRIVRSNNVKISKMGDFPDTVP
jgi:hypothetical protein